MHRAAALLSVVCVMAPAFAGESLSMREYEERCASYYAQEYGVSPALVRAIIQIESAWQPGVVSSKGAMGLMQLMPAPASTLGGDATLAEQTATGGAKFLRELLIRYHGDTTLALAAYNAGPGAVERYKGVPPYLETRRYIVKVLRDYVRQTSAGASANRQQAGNLPHNSH